jgi:hypothetical protein
MSYAKKSCNICGFRDIQPNMYRTEKSRVTGSSKTKITTGNLVGLALGQKNSKRKISNTLFANNKRQYTRKSVVWMCYECSGTGDAVRENVLETIKKGEELLCDARATGWLSKPADEATQLQMEEKIESLRVLEGETFNGVQQQAKDIVEELESMYRIGKTRKPKAGAREQASVQRTGPTRFLVSFFRGYSWFWVGTMTLGAVGSIFDPNMATVENLIGCSIMSVPAILVLKFIPKNV